MKNMTRLASLTVVLMLFGYGSQAFGQQYIAEKMFEESQKNDDQAKAQETGHWKLKKTRVSDDQANTYRGHCNPVVTNSPSGTKPDKSN